jgi:hypothetical protein
MKAKTKDRAMKLAVALFAASLFVTIAYYTSEYVQSSFYYAENGGNALFIDKYVERGRRAEFSAGIDSATKGALGRLGIAVRSEDVPRAYIATNMHYGVVNAGDRLLKKMLEGVPSSDFHLFRNIGHNMAANELIADTLSSRDGNYIFLTIDGDWKRAALHGYAHALAAKNMPKGVSDYLSNNERFDAEIWYSFRFVDEAAAMLVTDLFRLSEESGGLEAALEAYPGRTAAFYRDPGSEMYEREQLVRLSTFNEAAKSSAFYLAANDFSSYLIARMGSGAVELLGRFLNGDYRDLDELFAPFGGLAEALKAWKGLSAAPRSGLEAGPAFTSD